MKKVHIVNHTHWDREWYFSTMDSLVLSDAIFTEVIEELKAHPDAYFTLDGQISIIDEYLVLYPQRKADIIDLVNKGQLFIGPWYTQSDAQLVGGESILRNLMIGIYETKKIAPYMNIGYLPDTFGFHAQMPTILSNCGIDNIIFWRGIDYRKIRSPYFIWKGLGNQKVYAINFINGYGSIPRLLEDDEFLENKVFKQEKAIREKSDLDEIMIPIGNDQNKITNNIRQKLDYINQHSDSEYISSNYPVYLTYLKGKKDQLEVYEGEFRTPTTGRVHKTIGSVRYDIKKKNYDLEQFLVKRIEPLMVLADDLDIQVSKELLLQAWKRIMEGQAHDGMAGCINDEVAGDVLYRMKQAQELCDGIENLIKKRIADALELSEEQLLAFNLSGKECEEYRVFTLLTNHYDIRIQESSECTILERKEIPGRKNVLVEGTNENYFIDEEGYYEITLKAKVKLPAFGYKVLHIVEENSEETKQSEQLSIKNDKYHIYIKEDSVYLEMGSKFIKDFITFEDMGNDGDTYDFSPLRDDHPIYFVLKQGSAYINKVEQSLKLFGEIALPETLEDRIHLKQSKIMGVEMTISLACGSAHPQIKINVENTVESHRLRALIKTGIYADHSIASLPFGFITRNLLHGEIIDWEKEYLECPIDIEVMEESLAIQDEQYCAALYTKGIKEYQIQEDVIALTLFSTTGQLGKSDLLYRPGRASGDTTKQGHVMIATPAAQLKQTLTFEFMVSLDEGHFDETRQTATYEQYTKANIYYQAQSYNKFINRIDNKIQTIMPNHVFAKQYSMFSIENDFVSTIMPSLYNEHEYIIRLKNPTSIEKAINLTALSKDYDVRFVNSIEETVDSINEIAPYDFVQLCIHKK